MPASAIPSGSKSQNAAISNTPAAKGVPYLTNLLENFSFTAKKTATDNDNNAAATEAAATINVSSFNS